MSLHGHTIDCLNGQGFVTLVDWMGSDDAIVDAARASYGKQGEASPTLLRYLMRHYHTTPFEMCEVKFFVRVPMDCWRQWIRHRTANVNEYSTRYAPAIDECAVTSVTGWRQQATSNKQGSGANLDNVLGEELSRREVALQRIVREEYEYRLACGVAKEQARKDLPLSTFTQAYWKCDLHNIFNFLRLRLDSHAQLEIREYATAIASIVSLLFPKAYEAFEDYILYGVRFSRQEMDYIRRNLVVSPSDVPLEGRELEEFLKKVQ